MNWNINTKLKYNFTKSKKRSYSKIKNNEITNSPIKIRKKHKASKAKAIQSKRDQDKSNYRVCNCGLCDECSYYKNKKYYDDFYEDDSDSDYIPPGKKYKKK